MALALVVTACLATLVAISLLRRRSPVKSVEPGAASRTQSPDTSSHHRAISLAIKRKWDVDLIYIDENGARTSRRTTPQQTGKQTDDGRIRFRNVLFTGYCHLRRDVRHFRYDRIESLTVLAPHEQTQQPR